MQQDAVLRRAAALAALLVGSFLVSSARAAVPSDCPALGVAITEHSCFHAEHGPFATVSASAGTSATAETPHIDAVHTHYRVGLSGEYSVVSYTPQRAGAWAVLLDAPVPLQVMAGTGEVQPSLLDQAGSTGCAALPVLHVFELAAGTKYRFVFGPTPAPAVVAVVEYIDDFLTQNGRDADGDGFGTAEEVVVTPCQPPPGFAPNTRDCDDADPSVHPDAREACDGVDQNCNGVADDVGLACRIGSGACRVEGNFECVEDFATCAASPRAAADESCNGLDDDCNGKIDDSPDLCRDAAMPACIRSGTTATCGCQLDLDCSGGRTCNTVAGACEDVGVGGAPPIAGGGGEATSEPAPEAPPTKSGGCDCTVARTRGSHGALGAFVGIVAWFWRRRRRRARLGGTLLLAVLLSGCGGRVQESLGASGGGGAAWPDFPAAGGEAVCTPALGIQPREHACSHVTNGPFVSVVTGGGVQPPDVSELHHTYDVQIVGAGAALRYRAQRGGAHAFLMDSPVRSSLTQGNQVLATRSGFPVDACAQLASATVYDLVSEQEYELRLVESATKLRLFVEHLAAFGDGAWSERCVEPEGGE